MDDLESHHFVPKPIKAKIKTCCIFIQSRLYGRRAFLVVAKNSFLDYLCCWSHLDWRIPSVFNKLKPTQCTCSYYKHCFRGDRKQLINGLNKHATTHPFFLCMPCTGTNRPAPLSLDAAFWCCPPTTGPHLLMLRLGREVLYKQLPTTPPNSAAAAQIQGRDTACVNCCIPEEVSLFP